MIVRKIAIQHRLLLHASTGTLNQQSGTYSAITMQHWFEGSEITWYIFGWTYKLFGDNFLIPAISSLQAKQYFPQNMHLKSQKRQVPTHNDNLIQKTDQHIHSIVYVLFQFPFMPILTTLWRVGAAIRLHYEPIKQAGAERRGGQRRRVPCSSFRGCQGAALHNGPPRGHSGRPGWIDGSTLAPWASVNAIIFSSTGLFIGRRLMLRRRGGCECWAIKSCLRWPSASPPHRQGCRCHPGSTVVVVAQCQLCATASQYWAGLVLTGNPLYQTKPGRSWQPHSISNNKSIAVNNQEAQSVQFFS